MSSNFAGTETMLTNSDRRVGGGRKTIFATLLSKGGKPLFRLASLWTRNDFSFKKGGAGYLVCTSFHYEGGVC